MEKAASLSMRPSLSDSPQFSHSLRQSGLLRCQHRRGIAERLDPLEIKRRPGLAIRTECWSADDNCRHDAAKIVRCNRCIEMETSPCPSFETDTRCPHVGDVWVCCSQRS